MKDHAAAADTSKASITCQGKTKGCSHVSEGDEATAVAEAAEAAVAMIVAEIVVPDSYLGFLRLLIFIYTGDSLTC